MQSSIQYPYNFTTSQSQSFPMSGLSQTPPVSQVPIRLAIDATTFLKKFKYPTHTDIICLSSDGAIKSYNGILHNFVLPVVGDYSFDFQVQSQFMIKGINSQSVITDSINNYIDSASLNLNNISQPISRIDNFAKCQTKTIQELTTNSKSITDLNFLNLPILTKYIVGNNYQITLKFSQPPPIKYELTYNVMFVGDSNYSQNLHKEEFSIIYNSRQANNQNKSVEMLFKSGNISLGGGGISPMTPF